MHDNIENDDSHHIRTLCKIYHDAKLKYYLFKYIDQRLQIITKEDGYLPSSSVDIKSGDEPTFFLGGAILEALFRNIVLELNSIFFDTDKATISIANKLISSYKFNILKKNSIMSKDCKDGIYKLVTGDDIKYYQKHANEKIELIILDTNKASGLNDGQILHHSKATYIFENLLIVPMDENLSTELLNRYSNLLKILTPYRDKSLAHKDKTNVLDENYRKFSGKDLDEIIIISDEIIKWFVESYAKKDDDDFLCTHIIQESKSYGENETIWFFMNRLAGLTASEVTNRMLTKDD